MGAGNTTIGLHHPFYLPPFSPSLFLFRDPSQEFLLRQAINYLLHLGAIEPIPAQHRRWDFYVRFFLMPKKSGGWRPILDLKLLNKFVRSQKFRIVTLAAIIPFLDSVD